jgi:hypothetical protein
MAGIPHRSSSGPPEAFSLPFSPLCPRIRGLFPATEFAVAFSPSLPNPGDPKTTLACACTNFGDFTTVERSGAARSRSPPRSDLSRLILIARPRLRDTASRTRALRPGPSVSARVPWRWARSVSAPSTSIADAPSPPISARPPVRARSRLQI